MFTFNLKKTKAWVTTALLLLSFSICPHSCYPHDEEDENLTGAVENVHNDEDYESVQDNNDEEDQDLMEDIDEENDATSKPDCITNWTKCVKDGPKKCCDGLEDKAPFSCVSPANNRMYWCVKS